MNIIDVMAVRNTDYVALKCKTIIQWKGKDVEESYYSLVMKILEFKRTGRKNW